MNEGFPVYPLLLILAGFSVATVKVKAGVTIEVGALGESGWYADDSRSANGTDLVGVAYTRYGKTGQTATAADDVALAERMSFGLDGGSPNGRGGLTFLIDSDPGKASKSTIAFTPDGGLGSASSLRDGSFTASYQWKHTPAVDAARLVFRIGLQTSHYGLASGGSQEGFTASRTGESQWDAVLVYVPPAAPENVWQTTEITTATAGWRIYFQGGNSYWSDNYGLSSAFAAHSLDEWAAYDYDPATAGVQSFLDGASIVNFQFGLGSSKTAFAEATLATFSTSLLSDSYTFSATAIPEAGTYALIAGLGALGMVMMRRGRRTAKAATRL